MAKVVSDACVLCGGEERLQIDSTSRSRQVLCRFCLMNKTRMGHDRFKLLVEKTRKYPKLKTTIRYCSEKWLSEVNDTMPDVWSRNYQMSFYDESIDPSEAYVRSWLNLERIEELIKLFHP